MDFMEKDEEPLPLDEEPLPLKVGITYNLKKGLASDIEDIEAEYDSIDTVNALKDIFIKAGIEVTLLEADAFFIDKIKKANIDMVFNIAEGLRGRGREGQIPSILSFLDIPYTGSDTTTLCMALDKSLTKNYLRAYNVKSPRSQIIDSYDYILDNRLNFPLIVKPNCEGSSKGITNFALAYDKMQLKTLIDKNLDIYKMPMLAEEYIFGREFTVGLVGNGKNIKVFEPMEIYFTDKSNKENIYSFEVKKNFKQYVEYHCPPIIDKALIKKMKKIALTIFNAMGCRDFARIDFRMTKDGKIYFIELNPLPGLAPGYSDLCILAEKCETNYNDLVMSILKSAIKRLKIEEAM